VAVKGGSTATRGTGFVSQKTKEPQPGGTTNAISPMRKENKKSRVKKVGFLLLKNQVTKKRVQGKKKSRGDSLH